MRPFLLTNIFLSLSLCVLGQTETSAYRDLSDITTNMVSVNQDEDSTDLEITTFRHIGLEQWSINKGILRALKQIC
jgi:hypothetical protein